MKRRIYTWISVLGAASMLMTACGTTLHKESQAATEGAEDPGEKTGLTAQTDEEIPEEAETETGETEATPIETDNSGTLKSDAQRNFEQLDWALVKERALEPEALENGIDDDMADGYGIYRIARIPEENIALYGYIEEKSGDMAVAVEMNDDVNYFSWYFFGTQFSLPKVKYLPSQKRLLISLHIYTGTGITGDELVVMDRSDTGTLTGKCLTYEDYHQMLEKRMKYQYNEEGTEITFSDARSGKEVYTATLPDFVPSGEAEGASFGDISGISLEDGVWFSTVPGFNTGGPILYDNMPQLTMELQIEGVGADIRFAFGDKITADKKGDLVN